MIVKASAGRDRSKDLRDHCAILRLWAVDDVEARMLALLNTELLEHGTQRLKALVAAMPRSTRRSAACGAAAPGVDSFHSPASQEDQAMASDPKAGTDKPKPPKGGKGGSKGGGKGGSKPPKNGGK